MSVNSDYSSTSQSIAATSSCESASLSKKLKAIAKKSGAIWECIDRTPVEGGYLYHFKCKPQFDGVTSGLKSRQEAAQKCYDEMYPAVEPFAFTHPYLAPEFPANISEYIRHSQTKEFEAMFDYGPQMIFMKLAGYSDEEIATAREKAVSQHINGAVPHYIATNQHYFKSRKTLFDLGFKITRQQQGRSPSPGVYLTLPDRGAALARWEELRKNRPELPPISILNSKGIAGDLEFVLGYLQGATAVLSNGQENIHDALTHLMPQIIRIVNSPSEYEQQNKRIIRFLGEIYDQIVIAKLLIEEGEIELLYPKDMELLEAALGAMTDIVFSKPSSSLLAQGWPDGTQRDRLKGVLESNVNIDSFKRRDQFAGVTINPHRILGLWDAIKNLGK